MLALREQKEEDKRSTLTPEGNSSKLETFFGEVECDDEHGMPLELDAGVGKLDWWKGVS
jgi:hypothetical protein